MTIDTAPPLIDSRCALFLDFDGTLVDIVEHPDDVELHSETQNSLLELAQLLDGALAIVSGRDIRDLSKHVPVSLWRAGGHGVDICSPNEPPQLVAEPTPSSLLDIITAAVGRYDDVWCEAKGPVVAVHYRQAPSVRGALQADLEAGLAAFPDYRLQAGKMVFEAKPSRANKGAAVDALMRTAPFAERRPVMLGDDVTDEDGFKVAQRKGGVAIKVGEGPSVADYRLGSPQDVSSWLKAVLAQ